MTQESLALRKLKLSCRAPQDSLSSGQNLRVLYTSYIIIHQYELNGTRSRPLARI